MSLDPDKSATASQTARADAAHDCDVLIAGAGIAGLAAGLLLARAGLRVVCADPEPFPRDRVGESLDWSAPALLADLGIPSGWLVDSRLGTRKQELQGVAAGTPRMIGRPPPWVRKWPLRFELSTVHVDRPKFDQALMETARKAGVEFVWDGLDSVRLIDDRVVDCRTRSGLRISCRWFLDASGRARLLARTVGIDRKEYGVSRIALWFQSSAPMEAEATTLYFDGKPGQLSWIWEIPIGPNRKSIGVVMPVERFRRLRRSGLSSTEIVIQALSGYPHFDELVGGDLDRVKTRAFRCHVADRAAGANWLMIGEAAALVDPLTSLGVTWALRTGTEAASLIKAAEIDGTGDWEAFADYDRRIRTMADLYNTAINTLLYEEALRESLGMRWAARSYVVLGYVTNSLYAKAYRSTRARTRRIMLLAAAFRGWIRAWRTAAALARRKLKQVGR